MRKAGKMYVEIPFGIEVIQKLKEDNADAMFMTNKSDEVRILEINPRSDKPVVYSVLTDDGNEVIKRADAIGYNMEDNEEIIVFVSIKHKTNPGECILLTI